MKTPSFWLWFMANEKTLRGINHLNKRKRSKLIYWLSKHLEYYNPKIGFRLIVPYENQGTPSIAFSAGKNLEVRPHILHLMETAPITKNWIISASLTSLADNVLQLGEVVDLDALTFNLALNFIRNPNVQFCTEPAILPNCCCQ